MATETPSPPSPSPAPQPAPLPTAAVPGLRVAVTVLVLAAVGLVAWLMLRAADEEARLEQWDVYAQLRAQGEWEELFFEGEGALYQQARDKYVRQLEAFVKDLTAKADDTKDLLEPQARWRIVRTEGDSLLSMRDVLDVAKRLPRAENALRQLEELERNHPDFPLNWGKEFAPEGFPNATRKLAEWFRRNSEWEKEHLPRDLQPDASVTVVLRTERGDLRMGLYASEAPAATARFLALVRDGAYDGTCFAGRLDERAAGEVRVSALRAGDARTREAKAYDARGALAYASDDGVEGFLPDESRNKVLHLRGVVSAWHPAGDEYDHPQQLVFVLASSPGMNYAWTPLGRLLDAASLDTLDRIQSGKTWKDDPAVSRDDGDLRAAQDLLQVPVRIVKALAYKDGVLLGPAGAARSTKAPIAPDEQSLAGLKADACRVEPPAAPAVPPAPGTTPDASK
ncbi:MAG: peptidylprolyl isomerase [Planctomycetia bacterium]